MRRHVKKDLNSVIQMLIEATDTIYENIGIIENQIIMDALAECQQRAIYVGERIELSEGEGTISVGLLEEYCELLYQLSIVIEDSNKSKKLIKLLRNLLHKILNSITYDIPDSKKEVVFLPYKASMWDSLESVWKAASEDESCITYVIPIPYYDKNQDGSLGEMHYEGDEYPDYVPITSWKEYSISDRQPDVIYIHNPYDNANKVTSIHPDFYSKEIKKYTGSLVYIPYFVSTGDVPSHFCVLPGTMHADKVIVKSDREKNIYIKEFQRFEEENNCIGIFGKLEDKFLALGSPKLDRVRNSNGDKVDTPQEWNDIIRKADGTRKKVVLYNTTIQPLIKHQEVYLDKIQDVIDFFYKDREEYALLWRPHPLLYSTISSMSSNLSDRYINIVENYKLRAFGIFDDTADVHRAISISDAYYGDNGSMVALYRETGKPCMIQNVKVKVG